MFKGFLLFFVLAILACVWRGSDNAADTLLRIGNHLFKPENDRAHARERNNVWNAGAPLGKKGRPYLSQVIKKRVAARQRWRCAVCGELFDSSYEIDHVIPLCKGGSNSEENLQALCRKDHQMKTAMEQMR